MKPRVLFLDYLRVVACLMVMLVHASENFYGADTSAGLASNMSLLLNEQNRFWVAFWDGGVSRTAVPLFMITSAFLLVPISSPVGGTKGGLTMTQFYRRRFLRILPPFITFLLLYTFLPLLWGGMTWEQSMRDLRLLPFNFPSMAGHLWFMYPLISLYLIIPVVSPWLERATAREELIFIALFAFTTFIPFFHRFVSPELWGECFWNQFTAFWYCSGYLGYLVLAHYIRVHLKWTRRRRLTVGILSFLAGAVFTAWSFWWKGVPGQPIETPMLEWAWEFCTPNVLLATFGLFLLFTCIESKSSLPPVADGSPVKGNLHCARRFSRRGICNPSPVKGDLQSPSLGRSFVEALSRRTYGMYLMHMFFLTPIAAVFIQGNPASPLLPVWLCIPVIALLTYLCCAVTATLLSLLPGSKYFVG